jgi:hypothetical protein
MAAAAIWIMHLLTGQLAFLVGTLAVAALGYLLLAGRVPWRRSASMVIGLSIVVAASSIATVLIGTLPPASNPASTPVGRLAKAAASPVGNSPTPTVYDPYAGAAVPTNMNADPLRPD